MSADRYADSTAVESRWWSARRCSRMRAISTEAPQFLQVTLSRRVPESGGSRKSTAGTS